MEIFSIEIISPTKFKVFKDVLSCQIDTNEGQIQIFSNHTNFCSSINLGEISIQQNNEEISIHIYGGSVNFDNELNHFKIFCLDFNDEKEIFNSIEEISKIINKDSESSFHFLFSEDNKIALEKIQ
jgi:F0F1-type ATP synthase epsilon subunit